MTLTHQAASVSDGAAQRRSPLHAWHKANGARLVQRHGWQFPVDFQEQAREVAATRAGLAVADISPFPKYMLNRPLEAGAQMGESQPGKVCSVTEPEPGWLCQLSEDTVLLLGTQLVPHAERLPQSWRDVSDAYAGFLILGADAPRFLGACLDLGASPNLLAPGTCLETGFFGTAGLLARSASEQPAAVGLWVSCDVARYAWERIWDVGAARGLVPVGLDALKQLGWHA